MTLKEQPKRRGRGLAALLGDSAAPVSVSAPGVQSLGVEVLEPSPFQPRQEMDPAALDELAASISQRGILQPLLVRPKPGAPGHYQIIAGERRWRAAQKARLHEVPVLVRELSDTDSMAAGLVENLQRQDLNPVDEATGLQRLLKEFNMTHETLADAIGKNRFHITNSIRILTLPPTVLELVRDGSLSFGHARALAAHPNPQSLANRIVKEHLSVRQTENLVSDSGRIKVGKAGATSSRKLDADPETEALARQLSEKLGVNVKVTFDGKKGSLIINYKSLDQLDEVLALLNG
jgi:ParB family chromosome partitioning protein